MTCKHCKQTAESLGPVGMWQHCPEHEGGSLTHEWADSRPPDPCPACGQHGHAMAYESGPGPLCARAGFRDVTGVFEGADFYDCSDPEQLQHTDPADAVQSALDYMDADPETLEVTAYRRVEVEVPDLAERVLEDALERLDDMLGDPGGEPCEPTPAMQSAALAFAAAIAADYTPWQCEPCGRATVDVATWRKADGIPREEP